MKLVVVGAGTMGSGIAYASATAGHNVVVVEQDQRFLDQGMKRIQDYVAKGVARGVIDKTQATAIQSRLQGTVDFNKAWQNADFIV